MSEGEFNATWRAPGSSVIHRGSNFVDFRAVGCVSEQLNVFTATLSSYKPTLLLLGAKKSRVTSDVLYSIAIGVLYRIATAGL